MIDLGEPVNVVTAFPAGSATENEAAAVSVEVTVSPAPAVAVAFTVHTVVEVCVMLVIAEIPAVSAKSVPAEVDRLVQSSWWLPVTV